jgi:hypothetical protein
MSIISSTSGQLTWPKAVNISEVDMGNEGGDGTVKAEEYIKDKNKVLEWGSGTSTIYFSKIVKQFVSIEHNQGWYNYVSSQITDDVEYYYVAPHDFKNDEELDKNVPDLLCRANDPVLIDGITHWNTRDGFDWHCGIDYIRKPLELEYRDYDVVIVDGRCRTMCAYIAKYLIKDGGYLIFDDFKSRTYYHGILKYYEVIDGGDTLAILKVRENELSREEVVEVSEELYSTFARTTGRIR